MISARLLPTCFILLVLGGQFLLAARYYYAVSVGPLDDPLRPFDERFAWRMFSPLSHLYHCRVEFHPKHHSGAGAPPLALGRTHFLGWSDLLGMCRREAIEAVTRDLCERRNGDVLRSIAVVAKASGETTQEVEYREPVCRP
eukprot:TRINITY_DN18321_c0_g1_i1.p2 TRINITY_DN18321_c0_g1~~TRINITY_DN18321_c0_g1_i1.p2  ORF type:complete len:142 (-),score=20.09 TRINITY_DN18321_c0_g1_i1:37-462(-)